MQLKKQLFKQSEKGNLQHDIKIDTSDLLTKYVDIYGIRYVVRHFEIDVSLISSIIDGSFNFVVDEEMTKLEIESFQLSVLERKSKIIENTNNKTT